LYYQLLSENEYLRNASEQVIGTHNPYNLITTNNLTENNPNLENKNDHEIMMAKHKAFHKRQKTHINFGHIQAMTSTSENLEINQIDSNLNESITSSNTVVNTKVKYFLLNSFFFKNFRKRIYLIQLFKL
jgi:hypothetical protein